MLRCGVAAAGYGVNRAAALGQRRRQRLGVGNAHLSVSPAVLAQVEHRHNQRGRLAQVEVGGQAWVGDRVEPTRQLGVVGEGCMPEGGPPNDL